MLPKMKLAVSRKRRLLKKYKIPVELRFVASYNVELY
jgi:hypothetical protein